ncbi:MAG: ribonuclease P [Candidatus Woesearchaeota archaeon]|nr:ribonuclease P [Candidatus Woesearchaeota archaeon]
MKENSGRHKKIERKRKPSQQREIAGQRINELFALAEKEFSCEPLLSNRYVSLAIRISQKYKVPIPSELKRRFCKRCHSYLVPGKNLRVRLQNSHLVYYCLSCKEIMRFPYIREQKQKRSKRKL